MKMQFKMITALILAAALFAGAAVVPTRSLGIGVAAEAAVVSNIQQLKYDVSVLENHIKSHGYLSYYRSSNTPAAVKALQRSLNTLEGESLSIDGGFGGATLQSVKNFQAKHGLVVDGLFGVASVRKLHELVDSYEKKSDNFNGKNLIISSYLNSNLVLDNEGGRNTNENNIGLYNRHGESNQVWIAELVYVDPSGKNWYKLYPKSSSDGRFALNVNYGGNFNNLQMYEYSRSGNELFGFEPADNNTYYISSYCGGYLTCSGNFDGANVYRREGGKSGSGDQKWLISDVAQTRNGLDFNVAISYAKTYWNRLDPNNGFYMSNGAKTYDPAKFSTNGNNCANYVSALLLSAGLKQDNTWYRGSYAWINVNSMRNYFTGKGIKYISYPSSSQLEAGDILYTSSGHVMFITSAEPASNGTKVIRATGNTNSRNIDYRVTSFYGVLKTSALF